MALVDATVSQPSVSTSGAESGNINFAPILNIPGLNVPQYPSFGDFTRTADGAITVKDNTTMYLFAAVAGVAVVFLLKR